MAKVIPPLPLGDLLHISFILLFVYSGILHRRNALRPRPLSSFLQSTLAYLPKRTHYGRSHYFPNYLGSSSYGRSHTSSPLGGFNSLCFGRNALRLGQLLSKISQFPFLLFTTVTTGTMLWQATSGYQPAQILFSSLDILYFRFSALLDLVQSLRPGQSLGRSWNHDDR